MLIWERYIATYSDFTLTRAVFSSVLFISSKEIQLPQIGEIAKKGHLVILLLSKDEIVTVFPTQHSLKFIALFCQSTELSHCMIFFISGYPLSVFWQENKGF